MRASRQPLLRGMPLLYRQSSLQQTQSTLTPLRLRRSWSPQASSLRRSSCLSSWRGGLAESVRRDRRKNVLRSAAAAFRARASIAPRPRRPPEAIMCPTIVIVADDLTGAADCGIACTVEGLNTVVIFGDTARSNGSRGRERRWQFRQRHCCLSSESCRKFRANSYLPSKANLASDRSRLRPRPCAMARHLPVGARQHDW